jgi:hypothetical protein
VFGQHIFGQISLFGHKLATLNCPIRVISLLMCFQRLILSTVH